MSDRRVAQRSLHRTASNAPTTNNRQYKVGSAQNPIYVDEDVAVPRRQPPRSSEKQRKTFLSYPTTDSNAASVVVTVGDVNRLEKRQPLNNVLIDYFVNYVRSRLSPTQLTRFHLFESWFFPNLKKNLTGDMYRATLDVSVFAKEFLIIPALFQRERRHWCVWVVAYPNMQDAKRDDDRGLILLDSTNEPKSTVADWRRSSATLIRDWLRSEWSKHHVDSAAEQKFDESSMPATTAVVSQSQDVADIDVFAMASIEALVTQPVTRADHDRQHWFIIHLERKRMLTKLRGLANELRKHNSRKRQTQECSPTNSGRQKMRRLIEFDDHKGDDPECDHEGDEADEDEDDQEDGGDDGESEDGDEDEDQERQQAAGAGKLTDMHVPKREHEHHRRSFHCSRCCYSSDRRANLRRHLSTVHSDGSRSATCEMPTCTKRFKTTNAAKEHYRRVHGAKYHLPIQQPAGGRLPPPHADA